MLQTNITINDGASTPVAQVFTSDGAFNNPTSKRVEASWINRARQGVARLLLNLYQTRANQNAYKTHKWALIVPTLEPVVGGAGTGYQAPPKRAYVGTIELSVTLHERATDAEKADYAAFLKNLAANAVVQDTIKYDERMTG